jgi:hypothetical protein
MNIGGGVMNRKELIKRDAQRFSLWLVIPLAPLLFKIFVWIVYKLNIAPEIFIFCDTNKIFTLIMMLGVLISLITLIVLGCRLIKNGLGEY